MNIGKFIEVSSTTYIVAANTYAKPSCFKLAQKTVCIVLVCLIMTAFKLQWKMKQPSFTNW